MWDHLVLPATLQLTLELTWHVGSLGVTCHLAADIPALTQAETAG